MLAYIAKRLLLFIPTLLAISFLAFGLSRCTPGDPVLRFLPSPEDARYVSRADLFDQLYRRQAAEMRLDKPPFYFRIAPAPYPDTLYKIVFKDRKRAARKLIGQYGNWPQISAYLDAASVFQQDLEQVRDSIGRSAKSRIRPFIRRLPLLYEDLYINVSLDSIQAALDASPAVASQLQKPWSNLKDGYARIKTEATPGRLYLPKFTWFGLDNQYHLWISGVFKGDFGISYRDRQPAFKKIMEHLKWTVILNVVALILAYGLSVLLGVLSASRAGSWFDRATTVSLFVLYALPSFWVATILIVFFSTREYGMDWFATMGVGDIPSGASWWDILRIRSYYLLLPVFCLTYGSLAFITRQMRASMMKVLQEDYIRTARAKGLPEKRIIWRHAFRNALFPLITLLASVFPAALSGSVVLEVIFNIPGMGKLMFDSISSEDWPVVYMILLLGALLTIVGILVADLLYAWADPRVSFTRKK
ncbi:MAG TPA: ABC transporter permease [Flavilitoribacter sp.]|nr:ABC transporter permease [Flavilitoribacter sp.]